MAVKLSKSNGMIPPQVLVSGSSRVKPDRNDANQLVEQFPNLHPQLRGVIQYVRANWAAKVGEEEEDDSESIVKVLLPSGFEVTAEFQKWDFADAETMIGNKTRGRFKALVAHLEPCEKGGSLHDLELEFKGMMANAKMMGMPSGYAVLVLMLFYVRTLITFAYNIFFFVRCSATIFATTTMCAKLW
jgi:hypothetical protein